MLKEKRPTMKNNMAMETSKACFKLWWGEVINLAIDPVGDDTVEESSGTSVRWRCWQ